MATKTILKILQDNNEPIAIVDEPDEDDINLVSEQGILLQKPLDHDQTKKENQKQNPMPSFDTDVSKLELRDIVDIEAIQSLMKDFSKLTDMTIAILDISGKVLVATGWQGICTKYHRVHPCTAKNCLESDMFLSRNVKAGEYVAYKCKNHLWDIVTPLIIAGKHVGNVYTGQIIFEDEDFDIKPFVEMAEKYGFDKDDYLRALQRVPRVSREKAKLVMDFLMKFTALISRLGFSNLSLAESISQQRQVEIALRESEERFRLLLQQAPIAMSTSNEKEEVDYVNDRFSETFGYTLEDIPNLKSWWSKAYPDERYRQEVLETWKIVMKTASQVQPNIASHEFKVTCKDGTVRDVEIFGNKIGRKDLIIFNDITERKHAEKYREQLEEQLFQSQKMEAIGRLAGGVSHDLNNMLMPIIGYAEMAAERFPAEDPGRNYVGQILKAADRARNLNSQLLAFGRKQIFELKPIDLRLVVVGIKEILSRTVRENILINITLPDSLRNIRADTRQIELVLMNLAVNAQDAMPNGGVLTISLQDANIENQGDLLSGDVPPGSYVLLTVSDNGIGMKKETVAHIFEPFFTTKELGRGTGLGLSTVYGIIKQHGGYICVNSEPDKGTIFKIYIPSIEGVSSEQTLTSISDTPEDLKGQGQTILLMEDNEMVRTMVSESLQRWSYKVIAPDTVDQCIDIVRTPTISIDLLLTDVIMPDINGRELYQRLVKLRPELKALYISGYATDIIAQQGVVEEGTQFLQKPFTISVLLKKIKSLVAVQ